MKKPQLEDLTRTEPIPQERIEDVKAVLDAAGVPYVEQ